MTEENMYKKYQKCLEELKTYKDLGISPEQIIRIDEEYRKLAEKYAIDIEKKYNEGYKHSKKTVELVLKNRIKELKNSSKYPDHLTKQMIEDFEWVLKIL